MPSKSEKQRRFIFVRRNKYKSKENTPKDWKWIWDKEYKKVEENQMNQPYQKFFEQEKTLNLGGYIYKVYKNFIDANYFIEANPNNTQEMQIYFLNRLRKPHQKNYGKMGVYMDTVANIEKNFENNYDVIGDEKLNSFKDLNSALDYLWEMRDTF